MMWQKIALVVCLGFLSSCASINSLSLTPIPADRKNQVSATAERFIFLGFNFDNDFVDGLTADLKRKCPTGQVTGILTKDEVISYFLAHTRKVTVTGFCTNPSGATSSSGTKPRRAASTEEPTAPIEGLNE